MKLFTKQVKACENCPHCINAKAIGVSEALYICLAVRKLLAARYGELADGIFGSTIEIPDWCPLPDGGE